MCVLASGRGASSGTVLVHVAAWGVFPAPGSGRRLDAYREAAGLELADVLRAGER